MAGFVTKKDNPCIGVFAMSLKALSGDDCVCEDIRQSSEPNMWAISGLIWTAI
jgi:hypothetical protein